MQTGTRHVVSLLRQHPNPMRFSLRSNCLPEGTDSPGSFHSATPRGAPRSRGSCAPHTADAACRPEPSRAFLFTGPSASGVSVCLTVGEHPVCVWLGGARGARISNNANQMWILELGQHGGRNSHSLRKAPYGPVSSINSSPGGFCSGQL